MSGVLWLCKLCGPEKAFEPRHKALLETYLAVWNDSTQEQQQQLWLEYAADYLSEQDDVK